MTSDESRPRGGAGRQRGSRTRAAAVRRTGSRRRAPPLVVLGLATVATIPVAGATGGAELYAEHCATCHAGDGRGVPGVPDLVRGKALLRSDPELFAIIGDGKGVMPGYDGLLRGKEIRDVIAYLRTLR